jgi:hypothetical protein
MKIMHAGVTGHCKCCSGTCCNMLNVCLLACTLDPDMRCACMLTSLGCATCYIMPDKWLTEAHAA